MSLGHIRRHVLYPSLRPPAQAWQNGSSPPGVASTGHEITCAHSSEENGALENLDWAYCDLGGWLLSPVRQLVGDPAVLEVDAHKPVLTRTSVVLTGLVAISAACKREGLLALCCKSTMDTGLSKALLHLPVSCFVTHPEVPYACAGVATSELAATSIPTSITLTM